MRERTLGPVPCDGIFFSMRGPEASNFSVDCDTFVLVVESAADIATHEMHCCIPQCQIPREQTAKGTYPMSQKCLTRSLCLCLFVVTTSLAQVAKEEVKKEVPPARKNYMGRRIAFTMGVRGANWLIRANRQAEEDCEMLLRELRLKPGMTVCDMGCGNGFYALQMAKQVGEQGQVLAVDIQAGMLRLLQARAEEQEIENVKPILSGVADPKLPEGKVDLILCVDVYHEFSHPELMLRGMRNSLSKDGVIALAEYRKEDPTVPILPLHKMSKKQILKEYSANGLKLVREFDGLPWQHLMFFGRDDTEPKKAKRSEEPSDDVSSE